MAEEVRKPPLKVPPPRAAMRWMGGCAAALSL